MRIPTHPGLLLITAYLLTSGAQAQNNVQVQLVQWANGLSEPVDIANCGDSRLFVVERDGLIRIITDSMTMQSTPFLDISSEVNNPQDEQGLLGLVFDPEYAQNGYFYVYYTGGSGTGESRIARFQVSADSSQADPASETVLFTWPQPYYNHNGGDLNFGPDGYLYCGFGDGGSAGDPQNHAQTLSDPLGTLIRIKPEPDSTYSIPLDNPYVNAGPDTLPEIWANGLRNPWRFGFDQLTGDLWIGDVGQSAHEEVDLWPAGDNSGPNFGWHCYEGDASFNTAGCQGMNAYVFPLTTHDNVAIGGTWCSSVGGRVYRGTLYPHLYGRYFYTDYCAGEVWDLWPDGQGGWNDAMAGDFNAGYVCIAEGADGTLYLANQANGQVRKLVDKCPMDPPIVTNLGDSLVSSNANSYQWYGPEGFIAGATQSSYVPDTSGAYYVVANFGNGCVLTSDSVQFIVTNIADLVDHARLLVYPVPADDLLRVSKDGVVGRTSLTLYDPAGRIVLSGEMGPEVDHLDLSVENLRSGAYILAWRSASGQLLARRAALILH
ncbi:MAG: PQQ-dependent sugar dehydrogenase [Flavobacteriales bacterium]|nr:PQQ-dependent sugar dehydrogenase [Flavobacteriales bacterium]